MYTVNIHAHALGMRGRGLRMVEDEAAEYHSERYEIERVRRDMFHEERKK